jgi:FlaA1/EpsC-like NDP-sugar epimerase
MIPRSGVWRLPELLRAARAKGSWRPALRVATDGLAWVAALWVGVALRREFGVKVVPSHPVAVVVVAVLTQSVAGLVAGLYRSHWRYGSDDEVVALAAVVASTTAVALAFDLWIASPRPVPAGAVIAAGPLALLLMAVVRYLVRARAERARRPRGGERSRLLIFGAGYGGDRVLMALLHDPSSRYIPVALLDDDPAKRHLRISGIRVVGDRHRLQEAAARTSADTLLIAIPSADAALVGELNSLGVAAGLRVKALPPMAELLDDQIELRDIRDVRVEDLIGRRAIDTGLSDVADYLRGRRVLVTGAGGSIGSELCRQIHQFGPAELIMLDRDESALHALQLSLDGRALLDSPHVVLADIRDRELVRSLIVTRQPHVVFHAAALKHLTLLERHPAEAWRTNVIGTLNVLEAAVAADVERFVNISSDKAADPISILGLCKRIAERLTASVARTSSLTFLSVRFGNVLGSRGSVLEAFRAQAAAGGPLTVTDPDATRYFMTVAEATQLTIQAAAIGRAGEALVLDMGEPVRITDLARRVSAEYGGDLPIVYTGLRPGEKLHEDLFGTGEVDRRPIHALISHVVVPPLEAGWLEQIREVSPEEGFERLCGRPPVPTAWSPGREVARTLNPVEP